MNDPGISHRDAVDEFVDRIRGSDISSIRRVLLFGSVARASQSVDSDIDVLVIVENTADVASVEDAIRDVAYDIMLDSGLVFSIHAVTEQTLDRRSDHPFFRNVLAEAEQIYG